MCRAKFNGVFLWGAVLMWQDIAGRYRGGAMVMCYGFYVSIMLPTPYARHGKRRVIFKSRRVIDTRTIESKAQNNEDGDQAQHLNFVDHMTKK